jgi:hypothetical protein
VCHIFGVNRKTSLGKYLPVPLVQATRDRREPADQVRPPGRGAKQRLVSLPARDRPIKDLECPANHSAFRDGPAVGVSGAET